ncbi:MAG TPA: hypothetical protein VGP72_15830 [Planctomycetota bacterium]
MIFGIFHKEQVDLREFNLAVGAKFIKLTPKAANGPVIYTFSNAGFKHADFDALKAALQEYYSTETVPEDAGTSERS